jgi:hypothetical protein
MTMKCKALAGTPAPIQYNEQTEMSMVTVAKRIVEEGPQAYPSMSKTMIYTEMMKRAEDIRRPDETSEGAFARFATTDADGRALFGAYKVASAEDYHAALSADDGRPPKRPLPPPNAAHDALMLKAQALVEQVAKSGAGKSLTIEQAFEKVFSDKANRALALAALRPASKTPN